MTAPNEFDSVIDYEKVSASCDWMCLPAYFREALPEFLRQLAGGGYAVVRLPDMETNENGKSTWPISETKIPHSNVEIERDDRIGFNGIGNPIRTPEEAVSLAAALLAAAQHVQEKDHG